MVEQTLRDVVEVIPEGARVVHCCAGDVPIELLREAGADALSVDLSVLTDAHNDALGEAVDAGTSLWLGVLPAVDAAVTLDTAREPILRLWQALGFPADRLGESVVPTPACGLAGASPAYTRKALSILRDTGRAIGEMS